MSSVPEAPRCAPLQPQLTVSPTGSYSAFTAITQWCCFIALSAKCAALDTTITSYRFLEAVLFKFLLIYQCPPPFLSHPSNSVEESEYYLGSFKEPAFGVPTLRCRCGLLTAFLSNQYLAKCRHFIRMLTNVARLHVRDWGDGSVINVLVLQA